jgi:hypothetical protein
VDQEIHLLQLQVKEIMVVQQVAVVEVVVALVL